MLKPFEGFFQLVALTKLKFPVFGLATKRKMIYVYNGFNMGNIGNGAGVKTAEKYKNFKNFEEGNERITFFSFFEISRKCCKFYKYFDEIKEWNESTSAVQKVWSHSFCLFFLGNPEINYQGENVQEVCTTTLKIWRLYVCFSSCFSLVKVELPVVGAAKFEMCVVIRFLHVVGQLFDLESYFSDFPPWNPLLRCPIG